MAATNPEIKDHDPLTPIPLVIFSGFLGAGKTTRLNRWLKAPELEDTLVIINEFGEIGLDHLLVEEAPGDVVLMAAGCMCCTLRGDLVATLENLLRQRDNHRIRFFRQVLIETTGLADPSPILQSVLQHPYLVKRFAISGLVTLVDAVHGAATIEKHAEARVQIAMADMLIVTKTDLATPTQIDKLNDALATLNPAVRPLLDEDELNIATLFSRRFEPALAQNEDLLRWLGESDISSPPASNPHSMPEGEAILSTSFITEEPISEAALIVFQQAMRMLHGPRLLRLKGLIALKEDPEHPVVIHQVQSVASNPVKLARWPSRDRRTRLVFITMGIPREAILNLWHALERNSI
jgi:G3E family GTPase